jgi:hypothetical protein
MSSAPFCQIRSCTVASANASFSCSFYAFNRRSLILPAFPPGPGSAFSNPA